MTIEKINKEIINILSSFSEDVKHNILKLAKIRTIKKFKLIFTKESEFNTMMFCVENTIGGKAVLKNNVLDIIEEREKHYSSEKMQGALKAAAKGLQNIFSPNFPDTKEFKEAEKKFYSLPMDERQKLGRKFKYDKQKAIESLIENK